MATSIYRGRSDPIIEQIMNVLRNYETSHPHAQIAVYRQNKFSVRVRVIDSNFAGQSKVARSEMVWNTCLNALDDETASDIGTLILITPEEISKSFANLEFEHPVPSLLSESATVDDGGL